jgi:ribonuclease E
MKARLLEGGGPRLVHEESDLVSRAIRDILPPDCTRIVTDDAAAAERIREYLRRTAPSAAPAATEGAGAAPAAPPIPGVEVHPGPTPMFHAHGVEAQIEDVFRRTIRLPSGGSIVIDPTEALVAIDVNSGRMTGEEDLESTALKTDLEAVPEVARHLRLRDLGGVIVIDFIDLRAHEHVRQVEQALREALRRDRARIRMGRMGPFGCLELTRQRIRPALLSVTHVECPTCGGAGRRRHPTGLALRVLREMRARAARSRGHGGMEVRVPPPIADMLRKRKADSLAALEAWLTGPFRLVPDASLPYGGWSIKGLPPRPTATRPAPPPAGGPAPGPGPETA